MAKQITIDKIYISFRNALIRSISHIIPPKDIEDIAKEISPVLFNENSYTNPELTATVIKMAKNVGAHGYIRQLKAAIVRSDSRKDLHKIDCPVHIIAFAEDQLIPLSHYQEIANSISQAKLHILQDCGHLSTLEKPQQVNDILSSWIIS